MKINQMILKSAVFDQIILPLWVVLISIMPMEHVPALRIFLVLVVFIAIVFRDRSNVLDYYFLAWPMILWAAFCTLSWFWSLRPQTTAYHLRADLLPSILAFGVFSAMAQRESADSFFRAGMLLCATVNTCLAFFGHFLGYDFFAYYYPDVGYSSTIAVITMAFAISLIWERRNDWLGWLVLLFSILPGVISVNRMFLVICGLVWGGWLVFKGRKYFAQPKKLVAFLVAVPIVFLSLVVLTQSKMGLIGDKFSRLISGDDPRFAIWKIWLDSADANRFFGIGYGRSVGEYTFGRLNSERLREIDLLAAMHSHNIFINSFVETGAVGLGLFALTWMVLGKKFMDGWNRNRQLSMAGCLTVLLFLLKNQTDIFFLKSTMVLVVGVMGYYIARLYSEGSRSA